MTKKIFAMFLAVLMVVSVLPVSVFAAGCPAVHTLDNCKYDVLKVTDPTCKDKGYTTYQCQECKVTFVGSWTEATGEHDYEQIDEKAPTCSEPGKKNFEKCKVCGHERGGEKIDPVGGEGIACEWGEWNTTEFDCTKDFVATRTCKSCKAEQSTKLYEAAEDAEHAWGAWKKVAGTNTARRECGSVYVDEKTGAEFKCTCTQEMEIVATHDHNEQYLLKVEAVNADTTAATYDCTKGAVAEHYICRECGKLFAKDGDNFVETTIEKLTGKSHHETLQESLTCLTTSVQCEFCEVVLTDEDAHKYSPWFYGSDDNRPTCVLQGFQKRTCSVCGNTETRVVAALGHVEYTYTVDATCVLPAYTFTYCVRPGCTVKHEANKSETINKDTEDETTYVFPFNVGSNDLTAPVVGLEFYLNMFQGKAGKTFYFNGTISDEYLGTTANVAEAVKVVLVPAEDKDGYEIEGAYWLVIAEGENTGKYVNIVRKSDKKAKAEIADAPVNNYTWNETHKTLTVAVEVKEDTVKEFCLGTYDNGKPAAQQYTTFAATDVYYLTNSSSAQYTAEMTIFNGATVALRGFEADLEAGIVETAHKWAEKAYYTYPSTCDVAGYQVLKCELCGMLSEDMPLELADHDYNEVVKSTQSCTTDGVTELTCKVCGHKDTKVEEATGHNPAKYPEDHEKEGQIIVGTTDADHNTPYTYDYYTCTNEHCTAENKQYNFHNRKQPAEFKMGYVYDKLEDAQKDHIIAEGDELTFVENVAGTCAADGYAIYTCSGCNNEVRVALHDTDGEHIGKVVVPATCTEGSYYRTFLCTRCNKVIGEGTVDEAKKNYVSDPLGHDMEENENYVAGTCENPNFNTATNYAEYCKRSGCGHKVHDYVVIDDTHATLGEGENYCTHATYIEYTCPIAEHGSHVYNYIGEFGHEYGEWVETVKATCTVEGAFIRTCKYCGGTETKTTPVLNHKDAEGEFSEWCLEEARHCTLCCTCVDAQGKPLANHNCFDPNGDKKTDDACSCVKAAGKHAHPDTPVFVQSACGDVAHIFSTCAKCSETFAIDGTMLDKDTVVTALGHRPVAAGAEQYAAYDYVDYIHTYYEFVEAEDGMYEFMGKKYNLVERKVAYKAMYLNLVPATITTEGVEEFVCADCGQTIKNVLPTLNALDFELKVENANGQEGITEGSVVNVTLYANGNNIDVNNFSLNATFPGLIFVGAQPANENFNIKVTNPENTFEYSKLEILAYAVNTADKKQQNITIGEKTAIVTMTFVVGNAGEMTVQLNGSAYALGAKDETDAVKCTYAKCEFVVKKFLDFNEDGNVAAIDLMQAEAIVTGESDKFYDVTIDVDKDGEITLYDLNLVNEYIVNVNFWSAEQYFDFVCTGLAPEYVELLKDFVHSEGHFCPECKAELNGTEKYCTNCGRNTGFGVE